MKNKKRISTINFEDIVLMGFLYFLFYILLPFMLLLAGYALILKGIPAISENVFMLPVFIIGFIIIGFAFLIWFFIFILDRQL